MYVIMLIIWTVVSVLVMMGYRFFSGDGTLPPESVDILIGAPIAIVIFLALAKNRLLERAPRQSYGWIENFVKIIQVFAVWLLLPIFMNVFSTIAKLFSSIGIANLFFNLRYHSLYISIIILISYLIIRHYIKKRKRISFQNPA